MNKLGDYLRSKREKLLENDKTFSLRQVADRIGVQPSYLSKIERNIENPSEELLLNLCKEYDDNVDIVLAMAGKVSSRLQSIILKNPTAFSTLISSLENSPEHAIFRIAREIKDGDW